ncbi:Tyrosine--tRNA ligase, mitochondrial [Holothuria leucospilota]|uniref:Tyrosine--tRNA ligase n=1 Tax=Holothuria leucospilota TaxID=206669 RepID=A0A9Q1C3L5_HOLLE|nr:Tyrosine--tRNA ligase, mitochondrial [Holothuria leucospilota]
MAASLNKLSNRLYRPFLQHLERRLLCCATSSTNSSGSNILSLEERGLFHDVIPAKSSLFLSKHLNSAPQCIYCGFDPTADSLHIGNLLTLLTLIRCQRAGHQVIALIGGATALIGDPSGKTTERPALTLPEVESNVKRLEDSLHRVFTNHERYFWKKQKELPRYRILNNYDWYKDVNLVSFLSSAGRHFRMHKLLSRESVQARLSSPEGMSFQEFSYQIFQAYDFYHLHQKYHCLLQIGGSDQLGNLSTGHDFVKRVTGKDVYAITIPLITNSQGEKLGKTAGNAVWISADRTSPFELYQTFVRLQDADVEKYLKAFTFLSLPEIDAVLKNHKANPKKRSAQKLIAEQVVLLVHGENGLDQALRLTEALYNSGPSTLEALSPMELDSLFEGALTHEALLEPGTTVLDLVEMVQCIPSGQNAEKLISEGGLYVNQVRVANPQAVLKKGEHILKNGITLIRVGKKKYFIVKWI